MNEFYTTFCNSPHSNPSGTGGASGALDGNSSDKVGKPGNGWGDKNHTHFGPPGQNKKP